MHTDLWQMNTVGFSGCEIREQGGTFLNGKLFIQKLV